MSLRQRLLLLFSFTVAAAVAAVAWTVLVRIRIVFEQRDQEETALFVNQFQREFQLRSSETAASIDRLAANEHLRTIALEITQTGDPAPYLSEAQSLAQQAQLDFLEIIGPDGNIVSSAQWPARFGYPEPAAKESGKAAFLKREDLPDGSSALGLFAVRNIPGVESAVRLIGGRKLDQQFLADLPVAPGMQVSFYNTTGSSTQQTGSPGAFNPKALIGAAGELSAVDRYRPIIESAIRTGEQQTQIIDFSGSREDSANVTAIPLKDQSGGVLAVVLVALARAGMVEAQQHVRAIAYGVAAGGILLGIVFSLWIAARVSRPIEQLAQAAEEVAAGNWDARAPEHGEDEIGKLASSFNHMTAQLATQREQLIQSERVAAWRELARRLAHELKNPLFPLQLTVENLVRARGLSEAEFDEVFRESTATLSAEIANLKTIIARFSDFSKMPKPELERVDANDVLERVRILYEAAAARESNIDLDLQIAAVPMPLMVDPELLHRALSNLVLNAIDAMPKGGKLLLSAHPVADRIEFRIADTGEGLTPEECERLFTPYYTTKQHGTGLGLAIVQSIIADHGGTIAVESRAGNGATFIITLLKAPA